MFSCDSLKDKCIGKQYGKECIAYTFKDGINNAKAPDPPHFLVIVGSQKLHLLNWTIKWKNTNNPF